jgi:hypothetical protein
MLHNKAISVIPACPESFSPQRVDSGQAGMTLGCIFQLLYAVTKANFKGEGPLEASFNNEIASRRASC